MSTSATDANAAVVASSAGIALAGELSLSLASSCLTIVTVVGCAVQPTVSISISNPTATAGAESRTNIASAGEPSYLLQPIGSLAPITIVARE